MPRSLTGARLVLRGYRAQDARTLALLISDPAVQRWLPRVPHPYERSDADAFVARARNDPWKLAITLDDNPIGGIAISEEFGYWLGQPYWRKGFMTEAARVMLDAWCADTGGPLASGHLVGNLASRAVLLRLGFRDTERDAVHSAFLDSPVALQRMVRPARPGQPPG